MIRSPVDAVLFDLLSALLDSWSVWNRIAGGADAGHRWRMRYLEKTYAEGRYRDYLTLVAESAADAHVGPDAAERLEAAWDTLEPWPEAATVVRRISEERPVGIVTNCSNTLAARAAARFDVPWAAVVAAEASGWYKPAIAAYRAGLTALGTSPERTLFVAGSPFDVPGATNAGMRVFLHDRIGIATQDVRALATFTRNDLGDLPAAAGLAIDNGRNGS